MKQLLMKKLDFLFEAGDAKSLSKKIIKSLTMDESTLKTNRD